jgi:hypothetical protein
VFPKETHVIEQTHEPSAATGGRSEATEGDVLQTAREAGAAAQERLSGLRDAAQSTLEDAKTAAAEKAGEAKHQAADELARTAHGLEAAAAEMEGSPLQQDLLREAADGLKQIARAVEGKSIGAMVGELSEFGRHNPVAYLGGAALVGFALARFARASTPAETTAYPESPFDAGPAHQSEADERTADRSKSGTEFASADFPGGPEHA